MVISQNFLWWNTQKTEKFSFSSNEPMVSIMPQLKLSTCHFQLLVRNSFEFINFEQSVQRVIYLVNLIVTLHENKVILNFQRPEVPKE